MNAMDAIAPDAAEIHPGIPNAFFETNCIKGPDFDWDSIPDSQQVEIDLTVHVSLIFILSRTAVMVTLTKTV